MPELKGIHHVTLICSDMERAVKFYTEVLGLRLIKQTVNLDDPSAKHFYFGDKEGTPGTIITFFEYPDWKGGKLGAGITHHIAFAVEDEDRQLEFKKHLEKHGISVTEQIDRKYFKSLYFRDPDGVILEIATKGPGFAVDEELEHLGKEFIQPDSSLIGKKEYTPIK
jgi:glyoxalase family protein